MISPVILQPTVRKYGPPQLEELRDDLAVIDSATRTIQLARPEEVRIDDDGYLPDRYRLTVLAAQQLCSTVCSGLWPYVKDVGGLQRAADRLDSMVDPALAVRTINDTVVHRFYGDVKGLVGRQLVCNYDDRTVDGIVGPGYKYLSHSLFLESLIDLLGGQYPPAAFNNAELIGRRLSVVFVSCGDTPMQTADGEVRAGYCFDNSEAGECSVRAASILQLPGGCRGMIKYRHRAHSGRQFTKRLGKAMISVLIDPDDWVKWSQWIENAQSRYLGLVREGDVDSIRVEAIVRGMSRKGVPANTCVVIMHKLLYGTDDTDTFRRHDVDADLTEWDLFLRMVEEASALRGIDRDALEITATKILFGQVLL